MTKSDPGPTKEQLAVIASTQPKLTVTAAAGAGKTRVLVERYLRHVDEGIPPDRILTITFTKKAAAEMKRRIVDALRARGRFKDAQTAETGPIQTIHSFCERLLRENALDARLDPRFEILSDAPASRLLTECVREALASPLTDRPDAEALISSIAGKRGFRDAKSPYAKLESSVASVLGTLRGTGATESELAEVHSDPAALEAHWERVMVSQQPAEVQEEFEQADGKDLGDRLKVAWKRATNRIPAWVRDKVDPEAAGEAARHACGLVQLACEAWLILNQAMEASQQLDFTELEARAVRLLSESDSTRRRVRDRFDVVMVDEAQDLNPIQYRLLSAVDSSSELLVGDAQQSIYGFRQAEVRLFKLRIEGGAMRLSKNHRSTAGILNFVDRTFSSIWSGEYTPMNQAGAIDLDDVGPTDCSGVELWEHAARDTESTARYVKELIAEGIQPREIALLMRDGFKAVEIKTALERAGVPARIAGGSERFYTRMEVRDLANAMTALADPYDDFALLACLRSPVVGLSLDSIVTLAMQKPAVEALAGFVPPLDEDGPKLARFLEWYGPLKAYADRLSAWEVLAEVFAQSRYLAALARRRNGPQMLANVRKLLALAAEEPELGPLDYADRIRTIQELRHKEGDAPAESDDAQFVTIMTVHKAKGLEFPVVVVPQTDKPLTPKDQDVVVDAALRLVATDFGANKSLFYRFLSERHKARDREEELRVLYVALTRAKRRLCIAMYPSSSKETVSKRLRGIFGDNPPPSVRVRTPLQ